MRESDRRVCIYCNKTLTQVAKQRKLAGYRVSCWARPTAKGFHKYRYISVEATPCPPRTDS